jgi:hypothetical protein
MKRRMFNFVSGAVIFECKLRIQPGISVSLLASENEVLNLCKKFATLISIN